MSESEDDKAIMDELRAEMAEKAKALGIRVHHTWDAAKIESVIAEKALEDPTEPAENPKEPDEKDLRIAALEDENAALKSQVEGLLSEIRDMTGAPEQREADTDTSAAEEASEEAFVLCRISKSGGGKISDGRGGKYQWKDEVRLPMSTASLLEARGYVEVEE